MALGRAQLAIWVELIRHMASQSILYFGCRKVTHSKHTQTSLFQDFTSLERLVVERFEELNVDVDRNQLLLCIWLP